VTLLGTVGTAHASLAQAIWLKHAWSTFLRIRIRLSLRVIVIRNWPKRPLHTTIVWVNRRCSRRPLREVTSVYWTRIVIRELGVWNPYFLCSLRCISTLARTTHRGIGSHRRVGNIWSFWLILNVIFDHRHASASLLDDVVVLDGSEVQERLFLNGLARLLLLLHTTVGLFDSCIDVIWYNLMLHLLTVSSDWLLN